MQGKLILTINGGSSSIKFSIYEIGEQWKKILSGKIEKIGTADSRLLCLYEEKDNGVDRKLKASSMSDAADELILWLDNEGWITRINGIGHRLVFGMHFTEPQIITSEFLNELEKFISYDPDHLPAEISLIRAFMKKSPGLSQVACFDTSFHSTIPRLARLLPIPRRYEQEGVKKYGFHGLSYSYIMQELIRLESPAAQNGRIIIAHLGSGASMAAVRNGKCIDTSMGFTPTGGLVMATRTGDLDPGIVALIMKKENLDAGGFNDFVNHQCGLLGVAETGSDVQVLLQIRKTDKRAEDAISLFCYQAKKWIGSFMAVLGGLDMLVFTGGIGEHSPIIRKQICEGLQSLGIVIDEKKNVAGDVLISGADSSVSVCVMPTNEEFVIARLTGQLLSK